MDKKIDFILASKSARRREILESAGYNFIIREASKELDIIGKDYNEDLCKECAKGKARSVFNDIKNDDELKSKIIVASDTIVVAKNKIIGKPKDREDAYKILKTLSGTTHFVETAVCICVPNTYNNSGNIIPKFFTGSDKTYVTFRELTDEEIYNYIDNYPPYDKAGSYGIQDPGNNFHIDIKGDMDTILGFSMKEFYKLYEKKND